MPCAPVEAGAAGPAGADVADGVDHPPAQRLQRWLPGRARGEPAFELVGSEVVVVGEQQVVLGGEVDRDGARRDVGRVGDRLRVVMDLINIFRFDDDGRLTEEFVRTDQRSLLRQLGAEGR